MSALSLASQLKTISIPEGRFWKSGREGRGMNITCLQGKLWITQQDDPNDYILSRGQRFTIARPGMVLAEAIDGMATLAATRES